MTLDEMTSILKLKIYNCNIDYFFNYNIISRESIYYENCLKFKYIFGGEISERRLDFIARNFLNNICIDYTRRHCINTVIIRSIQIEQNDINTEIDILYTLIDISDDFRIKIDIILKRIGY